MVFCTQLHHGLCTASLCSVLTTSWCSVHSFMMFHAQFNGVLCTASRCSMHNFIVFCTQLQDVPCTTSCRSVQNSMTFCVHDSMVFCAHNVMVFCAHNSWCSAHNFNVFCAQLNGILCTTDWCSTLHHLCTTSWSFVHTTSMHSVHKWSLSLNIKASSEYRKDPKFLDRQAWTNNEDSLIRVYTVCHSICMFCSKFRIITGVRSFQIFYDKPWM